MPKFFKLAALCCLVAICLSVCGNSSGGNTTYYTSGMVTTKDIFTITYGKFVIRARLPKTQGLWPAHWLLPNDGDWPPEIDIMELLGNDPYTVYMTNHWGTVAAHRQLSGSYKSAADFSGDFHTFEVQWEPDEIRWYVDGSLKFSSTSGIPDEPFYLIINTAVGGDWPGAPDSASVFPQYHDIDYVRIYSRTGAGEFSAVPEFDDEFDSLDTGKWNVITRDKAGNYNNELQYYRPANVTAVRENGLSFLRITSLKANKL